ncbi:helix-turn-helix domain-containing protein [Paenibacillus sp. FSL R7-0337]|uniref:helix-turn-helix domain-containing protein n=1 Tax=Paenibacillus sp. FSL R7-0337 TaxID=1926588 RepID=UPI00096C0B58|nr:helix-turn-helix domain-containing protein [Paenibacillus sp. FSL R7-0337]OMF88736.1 hypothetical protein BK147_26380 [Paenibacillus sp. FSL R7-0337]
MIGYVLWGEEEAKRWYNGHLNSKEAAEYLGISRYILRKLVKEDKIPYSQNYGDVFFHKTILNAWMRGEFIPGQVRLILDKEVIDFEHKDALREHYERYPELLEIAVALNEVSASSENSEYKFEVRQDGVLLTLGSSQDAISLSAFLSNAAIDQLIQSVQKYRSHNK